MSAQRPIWGRLAVPVIIATMLIGISASGSLFAGSHKEYQLKAAYIYNFSKFVTWPPWAFSNRNQPFAICVLGQDPFGNLLEVLSRKRVKKREIIVRRPGSAKQAKGCHILFVSHSVASRWPAILEEISDNPILTVGDTSGFAQEGGMINFYRAGNKIRFEINREMLEESGLKASSTMLQVGRIVQSGN